MIRARLDRQVHYCCIDKESDYGQGAELRRCRAVGPIAPERETMIEEIIQAGAEHESDGRAVSRSNVAMVACPHHLAAGIPSYQHPEDPVPAPPWLRRSALAYNFPPTTVP